MTEQVRTGVIGIGAMGRNHVRVLHQLPEAHFIGAFDPKGDQFGVLNGHAVLPSLDALIDEGIEAAVVAVPSEAHEDVAVELARRGIHVLIEKPIASDIPSASRIVDAFDGTDLVATVGHVERFNAANQELRRRLLAGELGQVFSITTERVGPFPLRIRDVGVVKDLATHDIDLIHWLGGPLASVQGHLAHKMGRPHEDLIEAVGILQNGTVIRISVNWLTPSKRRRITVLGEAGALVADMLSADLTFYSNADVPMEWDHMQRLRGVSEGDMIRYAFPKREPLAVELENFCRAIRGDESAQLVTLPEGLAAVEIADHLVSGE